MSEDPEAGELPRLCGPYTLKSVLGAGGMAVVYRAEHTLLGHAVAIKMIRPQFANEPRVVELFGSELLALARIRHPNVVEVINVFESDLSAAGSKLKAMSVAAIDKIKGKAKSVSATESELEGKVTAIDAANHQMTIEVGGQPIELTVPEAAGIEQLQGKVVHVKLEKDGETFLVREIAEKK